MATRPTHLELVWSGFTSNSSTARSLHAGASSSSMAAAAAPRCAAPTLLIARHHSVVLSPSRPCSSSSNTRSARDGCSERQPRSSAARTSSRNVASRSNPAASALVAGPVPVPAGTALLSRWYGPLLPAFAVATWGLAPSVDADRSGVGLSRSQANAWWARQQRPKASTIARRRLLVMCGASGGTAVGAAASAFGCLGMKVGSTDGSRAAARTACTSADTRTPSESVA
mmetsp:Transcript_23814/g.58959  ORF Transcript_23814/g.58959 Transcript_23814/m.58959 type:complete len:228 (+) Transcript_23814:697-1380(+)